MKITMVPLTDIKPYAKNAKKHPKGQVEAIARSIKEFGFNQPVVLSSRNEVIVGHGRILAAIQLKMYDVPAIKASELTPAQIQAYRLADNKLNESDWDMELVVEELKALKLEGFDITLTGFDDDLTLETKEDDDALADAMGATEPIVKVGDLWKLGDHLLYCGDATEKKSYERLLGKEKARMIFTDPPYGIKYHDSDGEGIMNDDKKDDALVAFFQNALKQIASFSTADATLYWWYSERFTEENLAAWRGGGLEVVADGSLAQEWPHVGPQHALPAPVGAVHGRVEEKRQALSGSRLQQVQRAVGSPQSPLRAASRLVVREARRSEDVYPSDAEAGAALRTRDQAIEREGRHRAGCVLRLREYATGMRAAREERSCDGTRSQVL
jgi:hypothetical protein